MSAGIEGPGRDAAGPGDRAGDGNGDTAAGDRDASAPTPGAPGLATQGLETEDGESVASLRSRGALERQLQPVALMKFVELAGMVAFTIVAPRLMGPALFGEFAIILSLSGFLMMLCAMGGGQFVFGRFVPDYLAKGEVVRARALFMHILEFRLLTLVIAAPVLYLLLRRLLPEAAGATLVAATGAFVAMALAAPMYAVFFGYNRLALSMSRTAFSRVLLLGLLLLLGAATSLERASYALLATQLAALAVGVVLSRRLFTLDPEARDLASMVRHVRFGVEVFASTSLLQAPRMLGETMLAFLGVPSAQIGFFNIAGSGTTALSELIGQVPQFVIPSASLQHVEGDERARDRGLGLSAKYLSIAALLVVLVILGLGPALVRILLGEEYSGVVSHLFVLSLAILPVPLVRTALSLAVVRSRPMASAWMGLAAVLVFGMAIPLTSGLEALGVSVAIVAAAVAAALIAIWQMRRTKILAESMSIRLAVVALAAGVIVSVSGVTPVACLAAAVLALGLFFGLRILTVVELRALATAALGRRAVGSRTSR